MQDINKHDLIIIEDYLFPNTDINLDGWQAEIVRIDFINRKCFVNLNPSKLMNVSKDLLLEYDKLGFRFKNVEIPFGKFKKIENKSINEFIDINIKYPNRITAKTNILNSIILASISIFPLLFSFLGIVLKLVLYYRIENGLSDSLINNYQNFYFQLIMLFLLCIVTVVIFIKGIKDFLIITKLNTKGKTKKSKIEDMYLFKKNNRNKYYIAFRSENDILIHQKVHISDFEKLRIGEEIKIKYLDSDPKNAIAFLS